MKITSHTELEVFQRSVDAAMWIFQQSRKFPRDEQRSLTDQIRRSSRSVSANLTEAWRKRRYQAAFISKLSDADAEAAETQTWLQYAQLCGYITDDQQASITADYEIILKQLVSMMSHPEKWCF